jgi:succinate dehydrogenase assembly factor 1
MAIRKPEENRAKFYLMSRYNFRATASTVSPRNVGAIEHLIRMGRRRAQMYEDPNIKDCMVSSDMMKWAAEPGNKSNSKFRL